MLPLLKLILTILLSTATISVGHSTADPDPAVHEQGTATAKLYMSIDTAHSPRHPPILRDQDVAVCTDLRPGDCCSPSGAANGGPWYKYSHAFIERLPPDRSSAMVFSNPRRSAFGCGGSLPAYGHPDSNGVWQVQSRPGTMPFTGVMWLEDDDDDDDDYTSSEVGGDWDSVEMSRRVPPLLRRCNSRRQRSRETKRSGAAGFACTGRAVLPDMYVVNGTVFKHDGGRNWLYRDAAGSILELKL
ncbi:MAG: hypothetical protein M1825_004736 [Sarcosagium campestre]|nr:MAG: hypothetical protein M1825_004736 [Sarcosagium campestre]